MTSERRPSKWLILVVLLVGLIATAIILTLRPATLTIDAVYRGF